MPPAPSPMVRRRRLGSELRRLREAGSEPPTDVQLSAQERTHAALVELREAVLGMLAEVDLWAAG